MIDSRCGLHCTTCDFKEPCQCGGCIETMGKPFHGECPVALCCQGKGHDHCGQCDEIPCEKLYAYSYLDKEHGDKPPGERVAACRRWAAEYDGKGWENVLLTSAGFGDMEGRLREPIVARFLDMLQKPASEAKMLFIPAAAIDSEARAMAGKCREELLSVGILPDHIVVHNLDSSVEEEKAMTFDVVYFTGGDTHHLLRRVKETGFDNVVKKMVYRGKVFIGVSAGSLIATPNIGNPYDRETAALSFVNAYLSVHCPEGKESRTDLPLPHIPLTDNQALTVSWQGYEIIG